LRPFVSAAQHDHHQRALSSEIDPISWAEIDPEFLDAVANGLAVAEVAQPDSVQTGAPDTNDTGVFQ
jgi:hypothetical protein